jgi:hypothetical protein
MSSLSGLKRGLNTSSYLVRKYSKSPVGDLYTDKNDELKTIYYCLCSTTLKNVGALQSISLIPHRLTYEMLLINRPENVETNCKEVV